MNPRAIAETQFQFPGQISRYQGKVRDVYHVGGEYLVIVASDRISAFDYVLPRPIPFKGQVLNQTSAHFFEAVKEAVPTHVIATPDPNVTIGRACKAVPIEMVVRGYLAGHSWRVYEAGGREICGVPLPDGLRENDRLPEPIITPATKSTIGHDEDISEAEILRSGLIDGETWEMMKHYSLELFRTGTEMAASRGLILVDTKYEFGEAGGKLYVIDEIHTPDSSRYFYADGFDGRQAAGEPQKQLSKEFVRKWLIANGFQGLDGQVIPAMSDEFLSEITDRYIELYEQITGLGFQRADTSRIEERIWENTLPVITQLLS